MIYSSRHRKEIKHLRFLSFLSSESIELLKEQIRRTLRNQEKDELFDLFMSWRKKENEIMLYSDFSPSFFDLPASFDSFSLSDLLTESIEVEVIILYCLFNGWAPINKIEEGHRSVCLLQFGNKVPDLFKSLPEVNSKKRSNGFEIILFNRSDITIQKGG